MDRDFKELQIGQIAREILLREMQKLRETADFEPVHVAAFEKYTKLYLVMMDDMRKNMDEDIKRFDEFRRKAGSQQR